MSLIHLFQFAFFGSLWSLALAGLFVWGVGWPWTWGLV